MMITTLLTETELYQGVSGELDVARVRSAFKMWAMYLL